jgi:hypothetical protein
MQAAVVAEQVLMTHTQIQLRVFLIHLEKDSVEPEAAVTEASA